MRLVSSYLRGGAEHKNSLTHCLRRKRLFWLGRSWCSSYLNLYCCSSLLRFDSSCLYASLTSSSSISSINTFSTLFCRSLTVCSLSCSYLWETSRTLSWASFSARASSETFSSESDFYLDKKSSCIEDICKWRELIFWVCEVSSFFNSFWAWTMDCKESVEKYTDWEKSESYNACS